MIYQQFGVFIGSLTTFITYKLYSSYITSEYYPSSEEQNKANIWNYQYIIGILAALSALISYAFSKKSVNIKSSYSMIKN